MILTVIGILLSVISSVCSAYANVLLKISHNNKEKYDKETRTKEAAGIAHDPELERKMKLNHLKLWILVLLMYAGNVIFRFVALALVPISIIAPSSALTIAFNAVLAYYYFRERLSQNGWIGTILILSGCAVAMVVAKKGEQSLSVEELLDMYSIPFFYVFAIIQAAIFVAGLAATVWYLNKIKGELPADILEQLHEEHLKAQADALRAQAEANSANATADAPKLESLAEGDEPASPSAQAAAPVPVRGLSARADQDPAIVVAVHTPTNSPRNPKQLAPSSSRGGLRRNISALSTMSGEGVAVEVAPPQVAPHTPVATVFDTRPGGSLLSVPPVHANAPLIHSQSGSLAFEMASVRIDAQLPRTASGANMTPTVSPVLPRNSLTPNGLPPLPTHTRTGSNANSTGASPAVVPKLSPAVTPMVVSSSFLDTFVHHLTLAHPSAALEAENGSSRRLSRALSHASAEPVAIVRSSSALSATSASAQGTSNVNAGLLVPRATRADSAAESPLRRPDTAGVSGVGMGMNKSASTGNLRDLARNRLTAAAAASSATTLRAGDSCGDLSMCVEGDNEEDVETYDLYSAHDGQAVVAPVGTAGNTFTGTGFPVTASFQSVNMSHGSTLVHVSSSLVPVGSADAVVTQGQEAVDAGEVTPDVLLVTRRLRVLLMLSGMERALLGLALSYMGSVTCCWMNLTAKSVMACIKQTFKGNNEFDHWELYLLMIGLIVATIVTLRLLSFMMSLFDAVMIVPIYQCMLIIGLILVGIFYFDEFEGIDTTNLIIFVLANVCCLIGIVVLTQQKANVDTSLGSTAATTKAAAEQDAATTEPVEVERSSEKSVTKFTDAGDMQIVITAGDSAGQEPSISRVRGADVELANM